MRGVLTGTLIAMVGSVFLMRRHRAGVRVERERADVPKHHQHGDGDEEPIGLVRQPHSAGV
jgi:hypothetical protein